MTKTQPLMTAPVPKVHSAPVTMAPRSAAAPGITPTSVGTIDTPLVPANASLLDALDDIPVPIAAAICGVAAVVLLIQIWNYVVL
ncbi:hypothetical protein BH20VER1_BH20VER1_12900 [soil metagenome]